MSAARDMARPDILLLEDDPSLQGILADALALEGYAVGLASTFDALVAQIDSTAPPLVLADFWGTSHRELDSTEREEIRALASRVPLVLVTARSWLRSINPQELGLVSVVKKPFDLDELLALVRDYFSSREGAQRG